MQNMDYIFQLHLQTRKNIRLLTDSLTAEQLLIIPGGFNNNLLWNMGHVIVIQQLLCYRAGGLNVNFNEELIPMFKKDSSPRDWKFIPDINMIRDKLICTSEQFYMDYQNNKFDLDTPYNTRIKMVYGNTIASTRDAIIFNNHHEAMHLGIIMELLKFA